MFASNTPTFLAMDDETGLHCLVRLTSGTAAPYFAGDISPQLIEEFLASHDPLSFLEAISKAGPLLMPGCHLDREGQPVKRLLSIDEFLETARMRFSPSKFETLLLECSFDPFAKVLVSDEGFKVEKSDRNRLSKAREAVRSYDLLRQINVFECFSGDCVVIIEPLCDWVLVRNLLSISARIAATACSLGKEGAILKESGFARVDRTGPFSELQLRNPGYAIPLVLNAFFRKGVPAVNGIAADADEICPFFSSMTEETSDLLDGRRTVRLKSDESICFTTAPSVEVVSGGLDAWRDRPDVDARVYLLVADQEGESEWQRANALIGALAKSLCSPPVVTLTQERFHEIKSHPSDFPSAAWSVLMDHPGFYLMTCKQCGRAVLTARRGKPREFCSASCRGMWSREHEDSAELG